jgi:hypothetical protein
MQAWITATSIVDIQETATNAHEFRMVLRFVR